MKLTLLFVIITTASGCNSKKKITAEWPISERNAFATNCVTKAMAGDSRLKEENVKKYCDCYQSIMEKKYPNFNDLQKVSIEEITNAAERCRTVMSE